MEHNSGNVMPRLICFYWKKCYWNHHLQGDHHIGPWWYKRYNLWHIPCCLFGTKPLPKPMLTYCRLDSKEQTSVKFVLKWNTFHSWKYIWKCGLWNGGQIVSASMCSLHTVYPKKHIHGLYLVVHCCCLAMAEQPQFLRVISLALQTTLNYMVKQTII